MENLGNILAVGIGGFIGSVIRYLIALYLNTNFNTNFNSGLILNQDSHNNFRFIFTLPLHTFLVNIIGSLLIGILISYFKVAEIESQSLKLFLTTGLMGGLTTFSTFSFELMELLNSNQFTIAFVYLFASLFLGVLFCWIGFSSIQFLYK